MNTKSKKSQTLEPFECELAAGELKAWANGTGWNVVACRVDFHGELLEFMEFVNRDSGQTSYMRLDPPDTDGHRIFRAGPFGGGYSWTLPKYLVEAAERLAREFFAEQPEGAPA